MGILKDIGTSYIDSGGRGCHHIMSSFMLDDSSDTSASPVFKLYTCFEMEFESPSEDEESGSDIFSSDEDISDIVYDSNSSDSYDPEGISSDDDVDGCCHWSRKK